MSSNYTGYSVLQTETILSAAKAEIDTVVVPTQPDSRIQESYHLAIGDLIDRLKNRRDFVPALDDSAYRYGVNTHTIGYWLDYWANNYNFTAREEYLNQYPQFMTEIQGLNIHFIWIVPEVPEGKIKMPVLLLHGFPGSVREFYDAIREIKKATADKNFVLELIIPSLPGFGYSDNIIGYHSNMGVALTDAAFSMMSIASLNPSSITPQGLISRLFPLQTTFEHLIRESGYFHVHATKPDTLGISVSDSPSALMAWLFQQVSMCTRKDNIDDPEGGLHLYTPEQLLDNLMYYWMNNKGPTSFRIYAETFNLRNFHLRYIDMYAWLVLSLLASAAGYDYKSVPGLNYDTWWGPEGSEEDTSIKPFKITWKKEVIEDLVYRLKHRRPFTPALAGTNFNYGMNTDELSHWVDYWANDYNFTAREEYLNQFPHFLTNIQGLNIHFIWIKPEVPEGKHKIPLLMMHGYPGSVREFYDVINNLTKPAEDRDFVIELIMPSLPGFGYSDATHIQGMGAAEMGFIFKGLMNRLGHEKFYIQGGDWGSIIGSIMVTYLPDIILGYHSNLGFAFTNSAFAMISLGSVYPAAMVPTNLISRLYPIKTTLQFYAQEFGYFHIQAAKSDAIGVCVSESPTSLLAWFLHLFSIATGAESRNDPRGGLDKYSPEFLIDNIMMYWVPEKITSSMRTYAATINFRNYDMGYLNVSTTVPTVIVQALREIIYMPPAVLNTKFTNLVAVDVLDDYGHFLAMEAAEVFVEKVLSGLQKIMDFRKDNNNCTRTNVKSKRKESNGQVCHVKDHDQHRKPPK